MNRSYRQYDQNKNKKSAQKLKKSNKPFNGPVGKVYSHIFCIQALNYEISS